MVYYGTENKYRNGLPFVCLFEYKYGTSTIRTYIY